MQSISEISTFKHPHTGEMKVKRYTDNKNVGKLQWWAV